MARYGVSKTKGTLHEGVKAEQVKHDLVPGLAFEISDPSSKLINMIGGGYFNEPKYYDPARPASAFFAELVTTGKISSKVVDADGLTTQAREVIEAAVAVANSDNPEDLLIIAAWARDAKEGLRIRSTPQIMLAIAAHHPKTKPYVARYGTAIMTRADDVLQVFGAYRDLFQRGEKLLHKGSLPHGLRKALASALASQSLYGLLKYDGANRPNFADVLKIVSGDAAMRKYGRPDGYPLSKSVYNYFVKGVVDENAPQIIKARKAFFASKDINAVSLETLKAAGLTWENVISHLGSSKQSWELVLPLMNEQALTRNLRNFEQAGISEKSWDLVYEGLQKSEGSVQLPFQFFLALKAVTSTNAKTAVGICLDHSCASLPDLDGVTTVFVDNSGSCQSAKVSEMGSATVADAGNVLAAVVAKRYGRRAKVAVFGDRGIWVNASHADSCLSIHASVSRAATSGSETDYQILGAMKDWRCGKVGVGAATETGLWHLLKHMIDNKIMTDRIILLSDLCCYTQGDVNCSVDMRKILGIPNASIQSLIDLYRRQVNNNLRVYSINLNGHAQAQTRDDGKTHLMSGWSEKVISLIADLEAPVSPNVNTPSVTAPPVKTIDVLRQKYRRV